MNNIQQQLRKIAKELISEGKVDLLIGFRRSHSTGKAMPCIIRKAEEADYLIWDNTCANNLAVYLTDLFRKKPVRSGEKPVLPRVAIIAKGCDGLSIAGLIREKQVQRSNLVIIGVPCTGMVDSRTGELYVSCQLCGHPVAENADIKLDGESLKPVSADYSDIVEFEKKPVEERWKYFVEQMSKCIRCYACRQVCPNCYCEICFAENTNPKWAGSGAEISEVMFYHLGRLVHQVGRCVGCGACSRACPAGIQLHLFTRKILKDAKELFGFEPGFSGDEKYLFASFSLQDSDEFITDPEKTISDKDGKQCVCGDNVSQKKVSEE